MNVHRKRLLEDAAAEHGIDDWTGAWEMVASRRAGRVDYFIQSASRGRVKVTSLTTVQYRAELGAALMPALEDLEAEHDRVVNERTKAANEENRKKGDRKRAKARQLQAKKVSIPDIAKALDVTERRVYQLLEDPKD